jgi:hypothetical protein
MVTLSKQNPPKTLTTNDASLDLTDAPAASPARNFTSTSSTNKPTPTSTNPSSINKTIKSYTNKPMPSSTTPSSINKSTSKSPTDPSTTYPFGHTPQQTNPYQHPNAHIPLQTYPNLVLIPLSIPSNTSLNLNKPILPKLPLPLESSIHNTLILP